jgi:hypothetical protein
MKPKGIGDRTRMGIGLLMAAYGLLHVVLQANAAGQVTYTIMDLGTLGTDYLAISRRFA